MSSLRECASQTLESVRDGIGWILLWKERRSWRFEILFPDDFKYYDSIMVLNPSDCITVNEAIAADKNAILVNSYYNNLGGMDEITISVLTEFLKWQYEECHPLAVEWEIKEVA